MASLKGSAFFQELHSLVSIGLCSSLYRKDKIRLATFFFQEECVIFLGDVYHV